MDEITLFLSIIIAGFSLLLATVSMVAYYRLRATKLLIAFGVFDQGLIGLAIDFVIIVFLYFAAIKK